MQREGNLNLSKYMNEQIIDENNPVVNFTIFTIIK